MTFFKKTMLAHIDYNAWASQTLLTACARMPASELTAQVGMPLGCILATLCHIHSVETFWIGCLAAGVLPPMRNAGPKPGEASRITMPLAELAQQWPKLWAQVHSWVEGAADADLETDAVSPDARMSRAGLLLHVVNHASIHRGQIVTAMRLLGHVPPNTDCFGAYVRFDL